MRVNLVQLAGYINYPKTGKTTSGKSTFTGSLAVYRRMGENNKKEYDYIRIKAFEDVADALATVQERQEVFITGTLRNDKYTDYQGNTKYDQYVLVNHPYKEVGTFSASDYTTTEQYYPTDEYPDMPF